MKKSKIWIRVCVHLLLYITLGVYSSEFGRSVTDDITRISLLKHNIPKDYNIPIRYIPKPESGNCWVKLNVAFLEQSLKNLENKFGNISSNRDDIDIFIQMLQDMRYNMGDLEGIMSEFECHYRDERWHAGHYFDFLEDLLNTAREGRTRRDSQDSIEEECEPPPCPTETATTTTTTTTLTISTQTKYSTADSKQPIRRPDCDASESDCWTEPRKVMPEGVEISLLSLLLLIPIAAIVFLFVWKVKAKRNQNPSEQNSGEGGLFPEGGGNTPPLSDDISERNSLNNIEIV